MVQISILIRFNLPYFNLSIDVVEEITKRSLQFLSDLIHSDDVALHFLHLGVKLCEFLLYNSLLIEIYMIFVWDF